MDRSWTLRDLAAAVAAALASGYEGAPNGRIRDVPDARTIRYYTTLGLLDPPAELRGRTALYTERHLFQLVAIKRLQARGVSLAGIQEQLVGLPTAALRRLAAIPPSGAKASGPIAGSRRFWSAIPEPASPGAVRAGQPGPDSPTPFLGVPLGDGATLLLHARNTIHADDVAAIRRAAQPLVDVLTALGFARARTERNPS